ncbi:hypothetical protein [Burkholderia phage BCSR5]|nr:hypothetical protein [Burkholderia phage BCSR5]
MLPRRKLKKLCLFDVDGCLLSNKARARFLDNGDWESFHNAWERDTPIEQGVTICQFFLSQPSVFDVLFITSRAEKTRLTTLHQLRQHVSLKIKDDQLIMRPNHIKGWATDDPHDIHMPDEEFKPWALQHIAGRDLREVFLVYEDYMPLVERWRELGICCIQPDMREKDTHG